MEVATEVAAPASPQAPEPKKIDLHRLTTADRLWALRQWVEASQKDFAAALGIHPSTLRRYEAEDGRPAAAVVERATKLLNLGDFMTATEGPIPTFADIQRIRLTWSLSHVSRDQAGNLLCLIDEIQDQLALRRKAQQRSVAGRAGGG